jgi:hypothetical protein
MSGYQTFCAVQGLLLVYSAFVRAALAVTVCGYRCLAVLCLGLLLRQFSRIFAVPRPIAIVLYNLRCATTYRDSSLESSLCHVLSR